MTRLFGWPSELSLCSVIRHDPWIVFPGDLHSGSVFLACALGFEPPLTLCDGTWNTIWTDLIVQMPRILILATCRRD